MVTVQYCIYTGSVWWYEPCSCAGCWSLWDWIIKAFNHSVTWTLVTGPLEPDHSLLDPIIHPEHTLKTITFWQTCSFRTSVRERARRDYNTRERDSDDAKISPQFSLFIYLQIHHIIYLISLNMSVLTTYTLHGMSFINVRGKMSMNKWRPCAQNCTRPQLVRFQSFRHPLISIHSW